MDTAMEISESHIAQASTNNAAIISIVPSILASMFFSFSCSLQSLRDDRNKIVTWSVKTAKDAVTYPNISHSVPTTFVVVQVEEFILNPS